VGRRSSNEEPLQAPTEALWEASRWLLPTAVPYFIFDVDGVLQHANIAADAFLNDVESEASVHHHLIPVFSGAEECFLCMSLEDARSGLLPGSGTLFISGESQPYLALVTALSDAGRLCGIGVSLSKPRANNRDQKREQIQPGTAVQPSVTTREQEVLRCMFRGLSARELATELNISHNTARNHVQMLLHKFDAHSKAEAIAAALRQGLLSIDGLE
jgi:DNA-binding CsgD family transcriptional regulator